jgi:hypothetical protein
MVARLPDGVARRLRSPLAPKPHDTTVPNSRSRWSIEAIANLREALQLYFEDGAVNLATLPTRTYQFGQVAIDAAHRLT